MQAFIFLLLIATTIGQDTITLNGIVRDFQEGVDFERYLCGLQRGMVDSNLGPDNKPVLINTKNCVNSADSFSNWFRTKPGINQEIIYPITATKNPSTGAYEYSNHQFFPADNKGFGNQGRSHNYAFTFELHTSFTYQAGQLFRFSGDDDVWVFIDKKLVIDLGGVHSTESASANLDTLGLTVGKTYDLDFFFAERHTTDSNLIFSTSIVLNPCGTVDSDSDGVPDLCDACPSGTLSIIGSFPLTAFLSDKVDGTATLSGNAYTGAGVDVEIDWGDGYKELVGKLDKIGSSEESTYVYEKTGTYTITVSGKLGDSGCVVSSTQYQIIISDPCGDDDEDKDGINDFCDYCPNGNPILSFGSPTITGYNLVIPLDITGTISTTYTIDVSYGDGEDVIVLSSGNTRTLINHFFENAGSKTVTATISSFVNSAGCSPSTTSTTVKVGDRIAPSCKNSFVYLLRR